MKGLFGKTFQVIEQAIGLRVKRNAVLASNIANMDTPGYRPKDVPFKKLMENYMNDMGNLSSFSSSSQMGIGQDRVDLATTDPRHFFDEALMSSGKDVSILTSQERGTPNSVDIDEEMGRLAENNLQYQAAVQALIKEIEILKSAVTEGGRS